MPPNTENSYKKLYEDKRVRFFALGLLFLFLVWQLSPPKEFPRASIFSIESGVSLHALAEKLEQEGIVRSAFWFRTIAITLGGERRMKAGEYSFEGPENVMKVAWRMVNGNTDIEAVKVTIPEGFTVSEISELFDGRFAFFDNVVFERAAPEGYLFPDTYFVPVTATASSTMKLLQDNFVRRIFDVMPEVEKSGKSLEDIMVMASLIEGEANNQTDRVLVSAILWKRLKIGMPLQVDVHIKTYEFQGLPEEPINNPGLLSIQAAIHPTTTPYLYYLTGKDGKMYYAKNFDDHKANITRYLQ